MDAGCWMVEPREDEESDPRKGRREEAKAKERTTGEEQEEPDWERWSLNILVLVRRWGNRRSGASSQKIIWRMAGCTTKCSSCTFPKSYGDFLFFSPLPSLSLSSPSAPSSPFCMVTPPGESTNRHRFPPQPRKWFPDLRRKRNAKKLKYDLSGKKQNEG